MKKDIFLSVIIPAYNEEKRIKSTLDDLSDYFSKKEYSYEILIVNDGSKDNTSGVVLSFLDRLSIRILENDKNYGKGYSVKRGMLESFGEFKLFMDADNATPIDNLDKFLDSLKDENDVVIASIALDGAYIEDNDFWFRRFLGRCSKILIKKIIKLDLSDTQRGFKLFTKKSAEEVFKRQLIDRWGFDFELLLIADRLGFKIKEVAVSWKNKKGSKIKFLDYIKTLKDLFVVKKNLISGKYKI